MLQPARNPDFTLEAFRTNAGAQVREEDLDRHRTVVLDVPGEIYRGHTAPAELSLEQVTVGKNELQSFDRFGQAWDPGTGEENRHKNKPGIDLAARTESPRTDPLGGKRYIKAMLLPYRDDNPTVLTPFVTVALIAANVAVWVVVQGMGSDQRLAQTVCELGLIPGDLLHRLPIGFSFDIGAGSVCQVQGGNAWYTVFTSMFLHGGWLHLLGNMWFLWLFGNNIEDIMGHGRFLVFYLVSGAAAAAAQIVIDPSSSVPMVGASGAISGVMGAYVVLYPNVRVHTISWLIVLFRLTVPAWLMLGYWFALQVVSAGTDPVGGVAVWAHIGGFVAGAMLIHLFRSSRLQQRREKLLAARDWEVRPV